MISLTPKELIDLVLADAEWYKAKPGVRGAFCDANKAAVFKHRHNKGLLSPDQYDSVAIHFGFKKILMYTKNL